MAVAASVGAGEQSPRHAVVERDALPLFEPCPGGPAERYCNLIGNRHPAVAFLLALVPAYLVLACASILLGLVVKHVVLAVAGVDSLDERFPRWLAGHRSGE